MDSGSTSVFINRKRLPKGCVPSLLQRNVHSQTAAGLFVVNSHVTLRDIILPEFGRSLKIESLHACVFDADCKYDIIVGRDFMAPNNFDIKFSTQSMEWYDCVVPMKPASLPDLYHLDFDDDVMMMIPLTAFRPRFFLLSMRRWMYKLSWINKLIFLQFNKHSCMMHVTVWMNFLMANLVFTIGNRYILISNLMRSQYTANPMLFRMHISRFLMMRLFVLSIKVFWLLLAPLSMHIPHSSLPLALLLTLSNANGLFRKQIGSVIGSLPLD